MRISHRDLERARGDPRGFLIFRSQRRFSGGPTRFVYLRSAIRRYHKLGGDIDAAFEYLKGAFTTRRFGSLDQYRAYLAEYHRAFQELAATPFIVLEKMELRVSDNLTIGGQIDRVDLTRDGYSVWIFLEHEQPGWESELRFPLIQGFCAQQLGAPLSELKVGVYFFDSALYSCVTYNAEQVAQAYNEAKRLGEELSRLA